MRRRFWIMAAAALLAPNTGCILNQYSGDPLIRIGQQDISAHVDLRTLVRVAIGAGLRAGATAQRGLLLNLGFEQIGAELETLTCGQIFRGDIEPSCKLVEDLQGRYACPCFDS